MSNEYICKDAAINCVPNRGICVAWEVADSISKLPAADVRPVVHGHWEAVDASYWRWKSDGAHPVFRVKYRCSVCGRTERKKEPFCNCGAEMSEEENADV